MTFAQTGNFSVFGTSGQRSSRLAFGRVTGNDVSGHYKYHYFLFPLPAFFSSVPTFSHRWSAWIKKLCRLGVHPLHNPFSWPFNNILDFHGPQDGPLNGP